MRYRLPLVLLVLVPIALVACTRETPPAPAQRPAASAAPLDDSDCNFSTPLVPGIPGSPGNLIKSDRNPNGASELATLMRRFVDDLSAARELVRAGKPTQPLYPTHRKMRCSWPTNPSDRNEAFDQRAQTYLAQVQAFDAQPTKNTFNAMIAGCIACHAVSCQGPIEFIGRLKL